jgi:hypothetical protein
LKAHWPAWFFDDAAYPVIPVSCCDSGHKIAQSRTDWRTSTPAGARTPPLPRRTNLL